MNKEDMDEFLQSIGDINIFIIKKLFINMENDKKLKNFIKTTIREFLNESINNSFKIGDFVTYRSFDEFGLPAGIKWGEIVDIDDEYASIVLGGIDLNRTNHFKPNYMKPIRIRPIKDSDVVIKRKISSLSSIDDTVWGK